jgi:N-acetylmuramic acid 6-phosphate etherase
MTGDEPVTERREARHADLDLRSTRELVELVNDEDLRVAPAVRSAAPELADAIDAIVDRLERGGRLVYVGAGTSGHLAAGDAAECVPTFGIPAGRVVAVAASGEAEEDVEAAGAAGLELLGPTADDAVVAVSASGATPYVVGALRAAAAAGALTVAVVCVADSELGRLAEHEVVAVVGPEVIAGSTRMKAGTAQKLILNTISTVAMIRLGRTYGNLMVGVVAGNDKLRTRARRIVGLATDVSDAEVDAALAAAGGDARIAIVSLLTGLDVVGAQARLDEAGGAVRRAVEVP